MYTNIITLEFFCKLGTLSLQIIQTTTLFPWGKQTIRIIYRNSALHANSKLFAWRAEFQLNLGQWICLKHSPSVCSTSRHYVVYSQYHYCIPIPRRNWPIPRWWNSFCTGTIKGSNIFKVVNKLWVLYAGSTKALHASFFHCLRLAQSLFVSKKMDDVQTQFGSFFFLHVLGWQWAALCTHYKAHIVHNKIQKCIWATPTCVWAPPNTPWTCKWTIRKK